HCFGFALDCFASLAMTRQAIFLLRNMAIAKAHATMSLVGMTIVAEGAPAQERSIVSRRSRLLRPALGFVLPVTLALAWEIVVRLGWSTGRLAPPPSVIFWTFVDLARTGELQRDTLVTLSRVAAGFGLGAAVATIVGAATGYSPTLRRLLD